MAEEMNDLKDRTDILNLLNAFYSDVQKDPVIGIFFTEIVRVDWDHHIPKIADFWESLLLASHNYNGNVIEKHLNLNAIKKIQPKDLEIWFEYWERTIHKMYSGAKADEMISRGKSIAHIMTIKLESINSNK
jgi:hemoglobin